MKATTATTTSPATTTAPAVSTTPTVFVSPPPANANIPVPAADYAPATPGEFKNVVPRQSELAAMPQAIIDLNNFSDFAQVFGSTAPSHAEVTECFNLGRDWSTMRQSTSKWDGYCVLQEGYSWQTIRALIARLGPAFQLALMANPALATKYRGLTTLLGAKKTIAQKGASTRRLNKEATAKGEPAIHGVVGKRRLRKAQKAQKAALANSTASPPAAPAAPVVQPAAVVPAAAGTPANGASNGAAH